ncbi:probable disease resistance protein At4g27220 isoform X3 [Rhododendron vialii]|uniref:probable disease resistance protein At4g27220 isoform X3 n=1 Tax=Rhododendron vialii TaxID=182163 RepID=UPI00265F3B8E|nr:probable disease resistance protein At4g27220 isoform X3 [Rhododendron vialii]
MSAALIAITGLGKIAGSVLVKIGDYVGAPIGRQFTYMFCFNSNITEVEAQLKELEVTREGVQMGVDDNRRKGRVNGPNVEAWLKSANEVTIEVGGIIKEKPKVKEGCLNGLCPNIKLRYSLSRKAVKTTEVVIDLQAHGVQYTQTSYSPPPPCLETILNRDFTGFESRSITMEEIIKALKHDHFNLIGVCGMGGVGKTTMVNEVAKRAKEENHFDEVAMAVVSKDPNLTNVQACVADMLGLKLVDRDSPMVRADLLRKRLLQDNKKVLVILDDIWEDFDLQAMGIPLDCANKNFKLLYTSRTQDLWHDVRTKKEITLQLLSEDEAWQLFREKAGDSADARDLHPIAKQIVNECGGLPLALLLIGGVLSKKSGRHPIKEIWEGMLDRLICASRTPANEHLFSRLELSYKYLEDEEAKRLFLLCCLFKEDEDIRINNLAMYGLGLSLFDRINEMGNARRRVFLIVDDLKSRYLLLDSKKEECVRVHDVVRDMGVSIASKDKVALVSHGALSGWPKTVTYEPYTAISVISDKITKLPEGLTYPNLEFLILRCRKLKKLPPNFFDGMGKLKVLEIGHFDGILTLQSLRNLTMLSLEGSHGMLDNLSIIGDLLNLETLNFRDSRIRELPEEIGKLVNLRFLDLRGTTWLRRIPPGVISCLVRLEELYMNWFEGWEGEDNEAEGRNANLIEFESLSNLNTLEIEIRRRSEFARVACIPTVPIFSKLEIYKVFINNCPPGYDYKADRGIYYGPCTDHVPNYSENSSPENCKRMLGVNAYDLILSYRGGIDSLLRRSDLLSLRGSGCDDLVRELLCQVLVDGLQQLKYLYISYCHVKQECLVNAMNPVQLSRAPAVFPILKVLWIDRLANVSEIYRSPIPAGSFGELTSIQVTECRQLRHLFPLPIVGCLPQLTDLKIQSCDMMEEVIWREQREDVHVATNRIEFPKLESLFLSSLPSLKGFCRGIDHIDFPQLKRLDLYELERFNCLFHNSSTSHSEENDDAGFLSLFPQLGSLPNLEVVRVERLKNLERIGHGPLSMGSLSKLFRLTMIDCNNLLCVFPSELLLLLRDLEMLEVGECKLLEVVFELEAGVHSNEPNPEILSPLKFVELHDLPKLSYISKRDPMGFQYIQTLEIYSCDWLRYVFAPTMTKSIPQLRTLEISSCWMLSRIVAEENGLGESSVDEVEFPRLEKLVLGDLPNLVNFFPNVNTTLPKSTDHPHTQMQSEPLFNEKVTFPSLEVLILEQLPNVSDIWSSELPDFLFFKLKILLMNDIRSLRNMSHPSLARVLLN